MSVSSGSSLCGEQDQDLLLDEEEEIDFYAILNVPKTQQRRKSIKLTEGAVSSSILTGITMKTIRRKPKRSSFNFVVPMKRY